VIGEAFEPEWMLSEVVGKLLGTLKFEDMHLEALERKRMRAQDLYMNILRGVHLSAIPYW